jgi:hypothetical protein
MNVVNVLIDAKSRIERNLSVRIVGALYSATENKVHRSIAMRFLREAAAESTVGHNTKIGQLLIYDRAIELAREQP